MKYKVERYSNALMMSNSIYIDECESLAIPNENNGYKYVFEDEDCNILAVLPENQVKAIYKYKEIPKDEASNE